MIKSNYILCGVEQDVVLKFSKYDDEITMFILDSDDYFIPHDMHYSNDKYQFNFSDEHVVLYANILEQVFKLEKDNLYTIKDDVFKSIVFEDFNEE